MAFDKVTFRTELDAVTRKELDKDFARSRRWSSEEHHADGTHADITVDSLTVTGNPPTITFIRKDASGFTEEGTITSESGYVIVHTDIGDVLIGKRPGSTSGAGAQFAGLVFDASDVSGTIAYGFGAASSSASSPAADAFGLYDVTNDKPIFRVWKNFGGLGANTYMIAPDGAHSSVAQIYLGDRSSVLTRFYEVAARTLYGQNGVQEHSRTVSMGEWIAVSYSAGDFTGSGAMTWTVGSGDVTNFNYTLIGHTLIVNIALQTTTVAGTPDTALVVAVPGGFTAASFALSAGYAQDNGVRTTIFASIGLGGTTINIARLDGAAWTASANATTVFVQITIPIA